MSNNKENGDADAGPFQVFVDDNFHFMDEDERYKAAEFATYEEALAKARRIVDEELANIKKPGMTADELYKIYAFAGESPFILPASKSGSFSARNYAREQSHLLCSG